MFPRVVSFLSPLSCALLLPLAGCGVYEKLSSEVEARRLSLLATKEADPGAPPSVAGASRRTGQGRRPQTNSEPLPGEVDASYPYPPNSAPGDPSLSGEPLLPGEEDPVSYEELLPRDSEQPAVEFPEMADEPGKPYRIDSSRESGASDAQTAATEAGATIQTSPGASADSSDVASYPGKEEEQPESVQAAPASKNREEPPPPTTVSGTTSPPLIQPTLNPRKLRVGEPETLPPEEAIRN